MRAQSPIENTQPITSQSVPANCYAWVQYTASITALARALTGAAVQVQKLQQHTRQCPAWVPTEFSSAGRTFVREIELHAGSERVLAAQTLTHPEGDLVKPLIELSTAPLADLLFQGAAQRLPYQELLRVDAWYGRAHAWQLEGAEHPLLLIEMFDPAFVASYEIENAAEL